ncbi:transcription factor MafG-like [Acropora millepora]|uniref:transcription factor MafG-like n=1 Tax=Acropora millepora TaxID=45264 RepID=UPI001CF53DF2|nr:transcription factor MafG-like [Acropora millepora]
MVSSKDTLAFSLFDSSTEGDNHGFYDDDMSITNRFFEDVDVLNDLGLGSENEEMIEDTNSVHQRSHQERLSFITTISDEELEKMPIQDLNKHLRGLPKTEAQMLRKRRRILKNRSYATSCRQRRVASDESLKEQNQRLKDQLREIKEILRKTIVDRNLYKSKCERLEGLFQR